MYMQLNSYRIFIPAMLDMIALLSLLYIFFFYFTNAVESQLQFAIAIASHIDCIAPIMYESCIGFSEYTVLVFALCMQRKVQ